MKIKCLKQAMALGVFVLTPAMWAAQTASTTGSTTSSTTTSSTTDGATATDVRTENTEVQNTEVVNKYYDESDWRKNLTLSFGVDGVYSNADVKVDTGTVKSDPALGFGAMTAIELGLADFGGVALGVHYLQRKFTLSGSDTPGVDYKLTRTLPTLFIPLEARFYFFKMLSVGAGGFASIPVGNASDKYKSGNVSTTVDRGKQRSGTDWGLTGAIGVNVPIGDTLGVFGEARYNYGLTDSASNGANEARIRDLLFTLGLKLKI